MDLQKLEELEFGDDYVNPRKLPKVKFIQDVEKYVTDMNVPLQDVFKNLQEDFSKCKLIESKLQQGHTSFLTKVPEIEKNLQVIDFLEKKQVFEDGDAQTKSISTHFSLGETLFVEGEITVEKDKPQLIGLWLGANVMVEYTLPEAKELLNSNLARLKVNIKNTTEDLAFIREQIIVLEVNMARVYNQDVQKRQKRPS